MTVSVGPSLTAGKGFYDYGKPGGRVPQPDPEVEQLIIEESKRAGIKRRRKPPQVGWLYFKILDIYYLIGVYVS